MKNILPLALLLLSSICFGQTPIHHFSFNNTLSNSNSTITFSVNRAVTPNGYTADRFGNAASAKVLLYNSNSFDYLNATISDLPIGSSPRTITMWVKFTNAIGNGAAPLFG